ncbi:MAG: iron-siderophore ABC transporter substrate-binding protein [Actinomycetota bacterium]|jgi:iron complex transport system substrate-binding protein
MTRNHTPSRPTRRTFLLASVALLAGVACGGSSGDDDRAKATRTVTHAMGTTEVPAEPKRVVVLDTGELDTAVTLGVVPIGAVRAPVDDGLLDYLGDQTAEIKLVGAIAQPNLELIAGLKPDLILSSKVRDEARYEALSKIAPTVFSETPAKWKENFLLNGQALGKEAEAKKLLADYEARADELGKRLGNPGAITASVVRFLAGEIRLYTPPSYIGTVLSDVGLAHPPVTNGVTKINVTLSNEQIPQADGDIIFVSTYGPKKDTPYDQVTAGPLWPQLKAVKAGKAHEVNDETWFLGLGVGAANRVLDDLERFLPQGQ